MGKLQAECKIPKKVILHFSCRIYNPKQYVHDSQLTFAGAVSDKFSVGSPAGQLVAVGELQFAQDRRDVSFHSLD